MRSVVAVHIHIPAAQFLNPFLKINEKDKSSGVFSTRARFSALNPSNYFGRNLLIFGVSRREQKNSENFWINFSAELAFQHD